MLTAIEVNEAVIFVTLNRQRPRFQKRRAARQRSNIARRVNNAALRKE